MDSMVQDDDEGLWHELSHQQSREIAQHHARHNNTSSMSNGHDHLPLHQQQQQQQQHLVHTNHNNNSSTTVATLLQQVAHQTACEVSRYASVFYHAATEAWQEQRTKQQHSYYHRLARTDSHHHHQPNNDRATAYLNEFGIPANDHDAMEYTSLPEQQAEHPHHHIPQQQQQQQQQISRRPPSRQQQQQQQPFTDTDFVVLNTFALRPPAEGWGAVANLDLYLNNLYTYFYHRGKTRMVAKSVVELTTLTFTVCLTVFLFVGVDWKRLSHCVDEATCGDFFTDYVVTRPWAHWSVGWNLTVTLYGILFAAYTVFSILVFLLKTLPNATAAQWVFEERLGISARRLAGGAVDWDRDIVSKLLELQRSGEYRIAIHGGQELDALVVAQRIMRKENFLVALFHTGLLDLSVPMIPAALGKDLFCSSIEWCLYFCVLTFMFNHKYKLRPAFYLDPAALRRRFILCGIAHFVFMPFLLFSQISYFGLQNVYEWKSKAQYLGPKDWSMTARWKIREFNELPHVFERRLEPSYKAADDYLKLFGPNEYIAAIGRILVFIGGALGAVLFAFAAMNDAILLHVKIADWNLLWYAGVVGAMYSAGKAMLPTIDAESRPTRNMFAEIDEALANVSSHTHYYPQSWKGRGWDESTRKAFSSMYEFKAKLFAMQLLSLIAAPFILCISLANCAEPICEFILAIRAEVAGAGDVCGYSTFDFEKYSDETSSSGGRPTHQNQSPLAGTLTESILRSGNVEQAAKNFPVPKTRDRKMEHSFESFRAAHPSWNGASLNRNGLSIAEQLREESTALTKEQELHIEAATRQLETLVELEQNGDPSNADISYPMDESHIV